MNKTVKAGLFLALVLNLVFFPVLWGSRTLLLSSRDAPSIMPSGAFHQEQYAKQLGRTPDPGAPAWTIEPWFKIVGDEYWHDHELPLWNPYAAYGKPLAGTQQAQPFYPLALLLSLHVSPRTYDVFLIARLFVGGFLMFLFAREFFSNVPALGAAVTFMLSGYFIFMLCMPHISVEVMTPGILFGFERILRRNTWGTVSLAAAMIFCAVIGGMPEALFVAMAFSSAFFAFRLCCVEANFAGRVSRAAKFVVAVILGFGLAAPLLLSLAELVRVAHDTHQASNLHGNFAGLAVEGMSWRDTLLYLLPFVFGAGGNAIFHDPSAGWVAWGYWGVMPCLLGMTAVLRGLLPGSVGYPKSWRLLTAFFTIAFGLMLLKQHGSPIVNWVGALPIANVVLYFKYDQPLIALCVAMLAGTGLALIAERRTGLYQFAFAATAMLAVLLAFVLAVLPRVREHAPHSTNFRGVVAAGVLIVLAAVAWSAVTARPKLARWRGPGLLALLTAELFATFILPDFYLFNTLPSQASNPYKGAPYLSFLRATDRDYARVFARDGFLYPNWAGAFELSDPRSLDALEYQPYVSFTRNFLLKPGDDSRISGELADRFTGAGDGYGYNFESDPERRFLILSSIKYLVSKAEYGVSAKVVDDILAQHSGEKIWGLGLDDFPTGNGHVSPGLFEHPPSSRLTYTVTIDPSRPVLTGVLSIKEAAQDRSDGAGFTLEIKSGDTITPLFHTELDPRDVPADRPGHPFRVDLSRYAGQEVELLLSTDPGPAGHNAFDWAGWARLQFVAADRAAEASDPFFKEIYDASPYIYEVPSVLPRAALFSAAEILSEDEQILLRLKSPDFDPRQTVILDRASIPAADEQAVAAFTKAAPAPVRAAKITEYEPERVRIEAESDAPALLMLNDTDYPGWQAYVNGRQVPILRADYLFRAVMLPAGNNTVEFAYEPSSYRVGAGISALSLIALIALPLASRYRRRRTT